MANGAASLPDGNRRIATVADADYGRMAVAALTSHIAAQGGSVLQSFLLPVGTPDLAPVC